MIEFRLPDVGEGLHEAEIGAWLVAEGERVEQDQPLVEIETDKATVEIPAPAPGTVVRHAVQTGEMAHVGDLLVVIDPAGAPRTGSARTGSARTESRAQPAAVPTAPQVGIAGPGQRILASPVARKMALELGVDLGRVKGRGPAGRIMTADVERAAQAQAQAEPGSASEAPRRTRVRAAPAVRVLAADLGVDLADVPGSAENGRITPEDVQRYVEARGEDRPDLPKPGRSSEETERVPLRGVRRTIARRMQEAWRIPHVTTFDEIDARRLVALREELRPLAAEQGVRLTYLPLIVKIVARVLKEFPDLNASLDMEQEMILRHRHVHIGIATATDAGLLVPVIRHAGRLSVLEIAAELARLSEAAHARKLTPAELTGSTFTITNFGSYGGRLGTPIINPPEAAILGLGRIEARPVVTPKGKLKARPTLPLALSFDHRLIDGAHAGRFLDRLAALLTGPHSLFLELH